MVVLLNLQGLVNAYYHNTGMVQPVPATTTTVATHATSLPPMMVLTTSASEPLASRHRRRIRSILRPSPMVKTRKTIDDMVRMMSMEGSQAAHDSLMHDLLQLAEEITESMMPTSRTTEATLTSATIMPTAIADITASSTTTIPTRTTVVDPTTVTRTNKVNVATIPGAVMVDTFTRPSRPTATPTAQVFLDRVKDVLAASGIELVLPLDCGRNPLNTTAALEGGQLPWLVALGSRENGRFHYRCTGVIITNFHVLTDADCVASPHINVVQASRSGVVPDQGAVENYVAGRRIHPDIESKDDLFSGLNIGILELAQPFVFNDHIQPVCLPGVFEEQDLEAAYLVTVAGFNNIVDLPEGRIARRYMESMVGAEGAAPCYYRTRVDPDFSSMIHTLLTEKHLCVYISFETVGKSVLLMEDDRTGRVRVVGVGGFANARSTVPVAYTLVQPYRFWVELVLKKFLNNMAARS